MMSKLCGRWDCRSVYLFFSGLLFVCVFRLLWKGKSTENCFTTSLGEVRVWLRTFVLITAIIIASANFPVSWILRNNKLSSFVFEAATAHCHMQVDYPPATESIFFAVRKKEDEKIPKWFSFYILSCAKPLNAMIFLLNRSAWNRAMQRDDAMNFNRAVI